MLVPEGMSDGVSSPNSLLPPASAAIKGFCCSFSWILLFIDGRILLQLGVPFELLEQCPLSLVVRVVDQLLSSSQRYLAGGAAGDDSV